MVKVESIKRLEPKKCTYDMIVKSIKTYGVGINLCLPKRYGNLDLCCARIFDSKYNIEVGKIVYYIVNIRARNLVEKADEISGDLNTMVYMMFTRSEKLKALLLSGKPKGRYDLVCLIDNLYIEPEFRNLGVGTGVLKSLDGIFKSLLNDEADKAQRKPNEIIGYYLMSNPIRVNKAEIEKRKKDLMKLYEGIGYNKISKDDDSDVFYELWI